MTPLETYNAMSDEQLIEFVAARLPKILWRIQHAPRCLLCKESILDEIRNRPPNQAVLSEEFR